MGHFPHVPGPPVAGIWKPRKDGHKAKIIQALILTNPNPLSKLRIHQLLTDLKGLGFGNVTKPFEGIDANKYMSEADEMKTDLLPMTDQAKEEWMNVSIQGGGIPFHKKNETPETFSPNGALACILGHQHLWKLAAATPPEDARAWTIILEDDAKVRRRLPAGLIEETLANADDIGGIDIVHLDDRHCKYFGGKPGVRDAKNMHEFAAGSTAYAVTARGAQMLLEEKFDHAADHWLNMPLKHNKTKAFCPYFPMFMHNYKHASSIINNPTAF